MLLLSKLLAALRLSGWLLRALLPRLPLPRLSLTLGLGCRECLTLGLRLTLGLLPSLDLRIAPRFSWRAASLVALLLGKRLDLRLRLRLRILL